MPKTKIQKPFILIIFGASGDLAKLKLFPTIYSLAEQNMLPDEFQIVGYARSKMTQQEFKKEFEKSLKEARGKNLDSTLVKKVLSRVSYFQGQYSEKEDFQKLKKYLKTLNKNPKITKVAYFSVPPTTFKDIVQNLGETKDSPKEDIRLILEKPFGQDAASARELFHFVARYFDEEAIYLLDHYLGKTAVQSLLNLRHSNRLLNLMMKGPEINNIQITASENLGITNRIGYFDQVGTIKDMFQSHILQILALIAMSIPITNDAKSLHREKFNILSSLKFIEGKNNLVLGQYESYQQEKDVPKNSNTETFAAMRLFIDRESWYKTPIYIRTGKKMSKKATYIVIELKKFGFQSKDEEPNRLIFELQPEEKINIRLVNKHEFSSTYQNISTSHSLSCEGEECLPEHGLLLLDVMRKRRLHFLCFEEIIASWEITEEILNYIQTAKVKVEKYPNNSTGPTSQNALTETDGHKWFNL